jgi:hypothetical protein
MNSNEACSRVHNSVKTLCKKPRIWLPIDPLGALLFPARAETAPRREAHKGLVQASEAFSHPAITGLCHILNSETFTCPNQIPFCSDASGYLGILGAVPSRCAIANGLSRHARPSASRLKLRRWDSVGDCLLQPHCTALHGAQTVSAVVQHCRRALGVNRKPLQQRRASPWQLVANLESKLPQSPESLSCKFVGSEGLFLSSRKHRFLDNV